MTEDLLVKTLLDARPRLIAGACATVRDVHQAEDLFQDVLLRALRMQESFTDEAGLIAWAKVSLRNQGIDYVRRAGRLGEILSAIALEAVENRLEDMEEIQPMRLKAVRSCMEKLPDESRSLLRMRYDESRKGAEVSTLLNRSEAAIYKTLSRLHQALRKCVHEYLEAQQGA